MSPRPFGLLSHQVLDRLRVLIHERRQTGNALFQVASCDEIVSSDQR